MGHLENCGPVIAPVVQPSCACGFWTTTGTILVLYILLVIVLRAPLLL
ncbi:hypothetical protein GCM10008013_40600 [Paenibacillus segetis]|uniref:Sporulation protein YjcZ n=1 Tax=Paenibacillus segetis TaxID=1325360 RepID=A0ABQ1YRC1_9BACL|nr:hypothetical protein GCM10008013_40600 [Paenibacillus segetis]